MKILITGGAGFIASQIGDALIANGHQVVVVDNLATGKRENINPAANFYEMDIRDAALKDVFERERPDVVNHHAAQMSVNVSVENPMLDADINILGGLNLLENARKTGVKKVVFSSSGGTVYGDPTYLPCDEKHPIQPLSPYGAAKYAFEMYLHLYAVTYGLEYTTLRYANIYGPRQDPFGEAGVVAIFAQRMLAEKPLTIYGTGDQERDFVFVGDVVRANLMVLDNPASNRRAYNIGTGVGTSINKIYEVLKKVSGYSLPANYGPGKPGEVFRSILDAGRIGSELGWEPQVSLEDGLAQTLEFFRTKG